MRCTVVPLLLSLIATPAAAQQVVRVHLTYDTYAAGLRMMQVHAYFDLGVWDYRIDIDYHTTGIASVLYHGHQANMVHGIWHDDHATPLEFLAEGIWRGRQRRTVIDYDDGEPVVEDLQPPQETEREPVPRALRLHTMDTLSALAQIMRKVELYHSCETTVRTYDSRRLVEIVAHTVGIEQLAPDRRSIYSGPALRCDFEGSQLAGFLLGEDNAAHRKPLHGSAWLAPMLPGAPPVPVRIGFQTNWFGWATMDLVAAGQQPLEGIAHN